MIRLASNVCSYEDWIVKSWLQRKKGMAISGVCQAKLPVHSNFEFRVECCFENMWNYSPSCVVATATTEECQATSKMLTPNLSAVKLHATHTTNFSTSKCGEKNLHRKIKLGVLACSGVVRTDIKV